MNLLLVDDHQMMRDGLKAILESASDLHIVGEAADGRTALELCSTLHPEIVVMDINMPGLNGVEATRMITKDHPRIRVVTLSMNTDSRHVHAMFEAGAWAYLVKSSASEELVRAIHAVSRGEKYVSPAVAHSVVNVFLAPKATTVVPRGDLSPREREVLQLLAEGNTSKEIAVKLEVAVSTVETHRKQIMAKLEIHSVAELTKFAIRTGLTSVE